MHATAEVIIREAMARAGFFPYHSGGGCMAYVARYADGSEVWITQEDDAALPVYLSRKVAVGFYPTAESSSTGEGAEVVVRRGAELALLYVGRRKAPAAPIPADEWGAWELTFCR